MFLPKTFVRLQEWIRNICSKGKTFLRYFSLDIGWNPDDWIFSIFRWAHFLFWEHNFYIHATPYLIPYPLNFHLSVSTQIPIYINSKNLAEVTNRLHVQSYSLNCQECQHGDASSYIIICIYVPTSAFPLK